MMLQCPKWYLCDQQNPSSFFLSYHILTLQQWAIFSPLGEQESSLFVRHFTMSLLAITQKNNLLLLLYLSTLIFPISLRAYNVLGHIIIPIFQDRKTSQGHRGYDDSVLERRTQTSDFKPPILLLSSLRHLYSLQGQPFSNNP